MGTTEECQKKQITQHIPFYRKSTQHIFTKQMHTAGSAPPQLAPLCSPQQADICVDCELQSPVPELSGRGSAPPIEHDFSFKIQLEIYVSYRHFVLSFVPLIDVFVDCSVCLSAIVCTFHCTGGGSDC